MSVYIIFKQTISTYPAEKNGNTSRDYILKGIITLCQPNLTEPEG